MKKILLFLLFIIMLSTPSPSGNCLAANLFATEINDANKKQVIDVIINDLVSQGYSISTVNDYQLILRKDMDNTMAQIFFGSKLNGTPELRAAFNIIQMNRNVKITVEVKIVTNPNSGFERYTPVTHSSWQSYLDNIKGKFNGYIRYGVAVLDKKKNGFFEIFEITKNSSAEKEGLQAGDLIIKINDIKVTNMSYKKFITYLEGPEGSSVVLVVKDASGEEKEVTIVKTFIPGEYQKNSEDKEGE